MREESVSGQGLVNRPKIARTDHKATVIYNMKSTLMSQGASETLKINHRSQFRKVDVYLSKMKVMQFVTSKKAQAFRRLEISVGLLSPAGTTLQKRRECFSKSLKITPKRCRDRALRAWLKFFSPLRGANSKTEN